MKRTVMILGVIFLGHTTIANAATDWTPYLKPMMSGCNYPNPTEKLPTRYKTSIASKKVRVDKTNAIDGYGETFTTYT